MRVFMFKALALTFIAATADAVALEGKTIEASPATSSKWTLSEVDRYHPDEYTMVAPNSFAALRSDELDRDQKNKDQKKTKNDLKAPAKKDPKKEQQRKEEQKKKDALKKKNGKLTQEEKKKNAKKNKQDNKRQENGAKFAGAESNHKNKQPMAKELNNKNKTPAQMTAQEKEKKYFNEIEQTVRKNKDMVFMYVQSGCPYCNNAKDLLRSKSIPFKAVDLNDRADAKDFMESLKKKAKRDTVPLVYVN